MKNCYKLNLDFFPLKEDFVFPEASADRTTRYYAYGIESTSEIFQNWMIENNLKLDLILMFVHPVRDVVKRSIHLDAKFGSRFVRPYSINWNYGSDEILMEWWSCTSEGKHSPGQISHSYISYEEADCTKIEESRHTGPVLFRNSVPHSVVNLGKIPRYGISVRFKNHYNWEYITSYLDRYIVKEN